MVLSSYTLFLVNFDSKEDLKKAVYSNENFTLNSISVRGVSFPLDNLKIGDYVRVTNDSRDWRARIENYHGEFKVT